MKKLQLKKILAAALLLACLTGCSVNAGSDETGESTATRVSETTAAVSETAATETYETADTEVSETETDAYTLNPVNLTHISVLQSDRAESFCKSECCSEELYSERSDNLKNMYGLELDISLSSDPVNDVQNAYLSGKSSELLLLRATDEAIPLMCSGCLENLSAAGISIDSSSAVAVSPLAGDFEYAGRLYLLPFTGLTGHITSSYVLSLRNGDETSSMVLQSYSDGSYCFEKLISIIAEYNTHDNYTGIGCSDVSAAALASLTAAGGKIMLPGSGTAVPAVNVSSEDFAKAYGLALSFSSCLSADEENIEIKKISSVTASSAVIPLPPANDGGTCITPVDTDTLTVVCAPSGIIDGSKLAASLNAIAKCSETIISAACILPGDEDGSRARVILSSMQAEPASLYSWGDFAQLTADSLSSCRTLDVLLGDSKLSSRQKTAAQAAAIILSRLN